MQKSAIKRLARTLRSIDTMFPELEQEATSAKNERELVIYAKYFKPN